MGQLLHHCLAYSLNEEKYTMVIDTRTVIHYYNDFNKYYFGGDLPDDVYLGTHEGFKVPGRYDFYVNEYGEIVRQSISISRSFDWQPLQFKYVLIHEMIHLYLIYFGIDEGGKEHGPKFIEMMNMLNSKYNMKITVNQDLTQLKPVNGSSRLNWFFAKNF